MLTPLLLLLCCFPVGTAPHEDESVLASDLPDKWNWCDMDDGNGMYSPQAAGGTGDLQIKSDPGFKLQFCLQGRPFGSEAATTAWTADPILRLHA